MALLKKISLLFIFTCFFGCKTDQNHDPSGILKKGKEIPVDHATGFSLTEYDNFRIVSIKNPWPKAEKTYRYLLAEKGAEIPAGLEFDLKITVPVERVVVTSTTHISSVEILEAQNTLVGFPGLDYISSKKTRELISEGKIKELGENEALNTEILLDLRPDVVIGFSVDGSNKTFNTIQKAGIPVVFNSDWTEDSPLGKAEWLKFFGAFFNKTKEANAFFNKVAGAYNEAREHAQKSTSTPTVLAGSMYKGQWYLPYGDSWHAQFIEDANANYLYSETSGTGSMALGFESVLSKAQTADFWIGPAQFQSYEEMRNASPHYTQFLAFKNRNIHTFSSEKGETGGVLFYEIAPTRPDLVLKDLISIFHPNVLPNYQTTFYKPLK